MVLSTLYWVLVVRVVELSLFLYHLRRQAEKPRSHSQLVEVRFKPRQMAQSPVLCSALGSRLAVTLFGKFSWLGGNKTLYTELCISTVCCDSRKHCCVGIITVGRHLVKNSAVMTTPLGVSLQSRAAWGCSSVVGPLWTDWKPQLWECLVFLRDSGSTNNTRNHGLLDDFYC